MQLTSFKSFLRILLFSLCCSNASGQLSGVYTIGGNSPDFSSIQSAIDTLNSSGVSGNVTFYLRPGIYNERITIGPIAGISSTSGVSFMSETADSSDVWWVSGSTNDATNFVVKCQSARYITFKNISFSNSGYGSGVFILGGGTSNCTIESCHLKAQVQPVDNFSRHIQIYSSNTVDSNLFILGNTLENAGYGISLSGQNTGLRDSNLVIHNNIITGYRGITLNNIESVQVTGNVITSVHTGIGFYGFGNPVTITRNKVISDDEALHIELNSGNPGSIVPLIIANNFLTGKKGTCQILSGNAATMLLNNSICNRSYPGNYDALKIATTCSMSNNVIVNRDNGVALNIATTTYPIMSDYNLMHTKGTVLVRRGTTNFSNLQNWQSASFAQDQHSWQQAPNFLSDTDLHILSNIYLYNNAQVLPLVTEDFDGEPRGALPDIGADEFIQPSVDAELSPSYAGIDRYTCSGQKTLQIKLRNNGTDPLTSAVINWSVNGIVQTPVNWSDTIPYYQFSIPIDLVFQLPQDSFALVKVWVSDPNGFTDINPFNDSLLLDTIFTKMSGIYTVGNVAQHYEKIEDAVSDLILRGTCNNVTLLLQNGFYEETVTIPAITRSTLSDTLFIRSASGIRDSVTWTESYREQYALRLSGISNVAIRDITFLKDPDDIGSWYLGSVNLEGAGSSNFEFENCVFNCPGEFVTVRGIHHQRGNNLRIKHCLFRGFSQGVYLSSASISLLENVLIENSEFRNNFNDDIYVQYGKNIIIRKNHFTSTWPLNRWAQLYRGVSLVYIQGDLDMDRNRFDGEYSSQVFVSYQGPAGTARIRNNFFSCKYNEPNTGGSIVTCAPSSGTLISLVHNSFNVEHGFSHSEMQGTLASFVAKSNSVGVVEVKNNCFKADKAVNVLAGINPSGNPNVSHNNIYVEELENPFDFSSGNATQLNPSYLSFDDLHLTGMELAGLGTPVNFDYDIDSTIRNSNPTIGAYEAMVRNYDLAMGTITVTADCDSVSYIADIYNIGAEDVDSMWVYFSLDTLTDSLLLVQTLPSGGSLQNIHLHTAPLIRDTFRLFEVSVVLIDSQDELSGNDTEELTTMYIASPPVNLGNDTILCFDEELVLEIPHSPAYATITWNGQQTDMYSATALAGINTIHVEDHYSCVYKDTIQVNFESNPVLPIYASNGMIYGNGTNVNWFVNSSSYVQNVTFINPIYSGSYYYIWTSPNGCEYMSPIFESYLAVEEHVLQESGMYPNPSSGIVNFYSNEDYPITHIRVSDPLGRTVLELKGLNATQMTHSFDGLSAGPYLVHLRTAKGVKLIPLQLVK